MAPLNSISSEEIEKFKKQKEAWDDMMRYERALQSVIQAGPRISEPNGSFRTIGELYKAIKAIDDIKTKLPDFDRLRDDILEVLKKYPSINNINTTEGLEIAYQLAKCKYLKIDLMKEMKDGR